MGFYDTLKLYSISNSNIEFINVKNKDISFLVKSIDKFKSQKNGIINDTHLTDQLVYFKKIMFRFINSFLPYNLIIDTNTENELIKRCFEIKRSYPHIYNNFVSDIALSIKNLMAINENSMLNSLSEYINGFSNSYTKIAIVTKKGIKQEEKLLVEKQIKFPIMINYYTYNGFKKVPECFDVVIYIGTPDYFGEYAKNTFKGNYIAFFSYNIFINHFKPKFIFEVLNNGKNIISTIYNDVHINNNNTNNDPPQSKIQLEEEDISPNIAEKLVCESVDNQNIQEMVDACVIYLENGRYIFVSPHSKIRVFSPDLGSKLVKQVNFKDLEEDDYIIIRNERDSKLIAEVADQLILKSKATKYRELQSKWKSRLRYYVNRHGYRKVSNVLRKKYNIKSATIASIRNWCNEESICPKELPKLLEALKFDQKEINRIYKSMKIIQKAHIKAGKIISQKLIKELTGNFVNELFEKGYYKFTSSEFDGASFNIEKILFIDTKIYIIPYHYLMKPMIID